MKADGAALAVVGFEASSKQAFAAGGGVCTSAAREKLTDLKPDSFGGVDELGLSAVASATSGAAPERRLAMLSTRMAHVACSYVLVRRFAMKVWRKVVCQGTERRRGWSVLGADRHVGGGREGAAADENLQVLGEVYRYQPSQPSLETTQ